MKKERKSARRQARTWLTAAGLAGVSAPAAASIAAVPEPGTLALLGGAVGVAVAVGRFKGRK